MAAKPKPCAETRRLADDAKRKANWKRWGPYLSERQWGTVREDYSAGGDVWGHFTYDQSRSRAYRWGEDGLLGITDRECRLCFGVALWNGQDDHLKERLFGLTGDEGNHGEDVKEEYFYVDATPTYSYMKALYKYPQRAFPYDELRARNKERGYEDLEYELVDTGVFNNSRYFDVTAEYAKGGPDDILIRLTVANRGPDPATLSLLPTLWFRNTWSWGCDHEGCTVRPELRKDGDSRITAHHPTLGTFHLSAEVASDGTEPEFLFANNETHAEQLYDQPSPSPYVKDAFHRLIVHGEADAVNPEARGTKVAAHYAFYVRPGQSVTVRLRLTADDATPFGRAFNTIFSRRIKEADAFYEERDGGGSSEERAIARQAYAGLLWSKQFYHYVVENWLNGDPALPPPPNERLDGRNADWPHLFNRDIISMPDKWEYPWYAAWDTAFHMIPMARIDPDFAKWQLNLFLREWYMHPNGQLPAYEWNLSDVNPPVHAWACWRVYKIAAPRGKRDRRFLASVFQKLLLNFTWWVNRKDAHGRHVFGGGFLGLDNITVFDRSKPVPGGCNLDQADATAWMAFYCATMLAMALELAEEQPEYEDIASKFFEHFVAITDAMNSLGGTGLWDEEDGLYYDQLCSGENAVPLKVRSMVSLLPLIAVTVLDMDVVNRLPGFRKRMEWFLEHKPEMASYSSYACSLAGGDQGPHCKRLLAIPSEERLRRVLRVMLDEAEFLSPFGIRSLSKYHGEHPFCLFVEGANFCVDYVPGESNSGLFGGNSNWRGPVWFPINYLLIEALERYHHFYGPAFAIECPTGSGNIMSLKDVADELSRRLTRLFLPDDSGRRPCHGSHPLCSDPHWSNLHLFHEYFHGDTGRGLGASHQTGWTALVARLFL
jgi:Mannosylglycerate hydrolase MGH1-like glycoside hydrolase domain